MVDRSLHGLVPDYLSSKFEKKNEKPRTTLGTLRTNSMFHYRALTITKIALPIAAQSYGKVFLPTYDKQSHLGNLKVY